MSSSTWRVASAVVAAGLAFSPLASAGEPNFRNLVRKYVQAQAAGEEAEPLPGLPEELQKVVALEYKVLLRSPEGEVPVDPVTHQFNVGDREEGGDQIRVQIQPLSDLYIYIFYEGVGGERKCLLPDPAFEDRPTLARSDEVLTLPDDQTAFTFIPPAGEDKLIVVATEEPYEDLEALANVVFEKPDDVLTEEEQQLKEKLKKLADIKLESISNDQAKGTRYRGMFDEEGLEQVAEQIQQERTTRAVLEEPPSGGEGSSFAMAATLKNNKRAELYVTIPLNSVEPAAGGR